MYPKHAIYAGSNGAIYYQALYWSQETSWKVSKYFLSIYQTHAIITRGLFIFSLFFTAVYIVELYKDILQILGLKSVVYNLERFQIKSGL